MNTPRANPNIKKTRLKIFRSPNASLSSGRVLLRTTLIVIRLSEIVITPDLIIANHEEEALVEVEGVKAKIELVNKITTTPAAITTTTIVKALSRRGLTKHY